MCGICGMLGKNLISTEYKAFDTLFHISALRGSDSCGIMGIHQSEKDPNKYIAAMSKSLLTSTEYLYHEREAIDKYREDKKPIILIGHCRWATQGKITKQNAHPFNFPNLIGVHNGTITSPIDNREKFETDSETLFAKINEVGITKTIKNLRTYGAAYVLNWFDKKEQTLNFIRNSDRPLYLVVTKLQTLYWASERDFLEFTLKRYNIEYDKIFSLETDTLLSYHLNATTKETKFTTEKLKPMEWHERPESRDSIWSHGRFHKPWEQEEIEIEKENPRTIERWNNTTRKWEVIEVFPKKTNNVISLPPAPGVKKIGEPVTMYKFKNEIMNAANLDQVLRAGCCGCRKNHFTHKDFNEIQWTNNVKIHEFICDECANESQDMKDIASGMGAEYGWIIFRGKEIKEEPLNDPMPKHMMH